MSESRQNFPAAYKLAEFRPQIFGHTKFQTQEKCLRPGNWLDLILFLEPVIIPLIAHQLPRNFIRCHAPPVEKMPVAMDEVMSAVCSFQKFNRAVPRPATKIDAAKDDCFIRSCHPLFLAHYLVHRAKRKGWQTHHPLLPGEHQKTIVQIDSGTKCNSNKQVSFLNSTITSTTPILPISNIPSSTSTNNNPTSHYDGGNSDILAELDRWNSFFSAPDTDPKAVLTSELRYLRKSVKDALNTTINGSDKYPKFIRWFKTNFPLLHAVWARTNMATVGNEISCYYETALMQDMGLYHLAEDLGLHLTYEYDGCGVMCREDDAEALAKIQQLIAHVQASSEQMWGIRPVVVVKTATGEQVDMQTVGTDATERPGVTKRQRGAIPATRTVASASRRPSNRSARPSRKPRGSSRPSRT